MRVSRRELFITEQGALPIGSDLPMAHFSRTRLRQLYEQRRIEPINPPVNTRQAHRERNQPTAVAQVAQPTEPALASPYSPTRSRGRKKGGAVTTQAAPPISSASAAVLRRVVPVVQPAALKGER
jgi:hypothetical protein